MFRLAFLLTSAGAVVGGTHYTLDQASQSFCSWQSQYQAGLEMSGEEFPELDDCMMERPD